jgi:hypothetical protein
MKQTGQTFLETAKGIELKVNTLDPVNNGQITYNGTKFRKKQGGIVSDLDTVGAGGTTSIMDVKTADFSNTIDTGLSPIGIVINGHTIALNDLVLLCDINGDWGVFVATPSSLDLTYTPSIVHVTDGVFSGNNYNYNFDASFAYPSTYILIGNQKITFTATIGLYFVKNIVDSSIYPTRKIGITWGNYLSTDENAPDYSINISVVPKVGSYDIIMEASNNNKFGGIFNFLITK